MMPGRSLSPEFIRSAVAATLTPYKVPSVVIVAESLPLTTTGKIKRQDLRAMLIAAEAST